MTTQTLIVVLLSLFVVMPIAALGAFALRFALLLRQDDETFSSVMAAGGGVVCILGACTLSALMYKSPPGGSEVPTEAPATAVHKNCTCTCDDDRRRP